MTTSADMIPTNTVHNPAVTAQATMISSTANAAISSAQVINITLEISFTLKNVAELIDALNAVAANIIVATNTTNAIINTINNVITLNNRLTSFGFSQYRSSDIM
ncbi:unnamed protein product [Cunninghamella echinulata]